MNHHKIITPEQKAAFFRNVRSIDFSVTFGSLLQVFCLRWKVKFLGNPIWLRVDRELVV